MSSGSQAPPPIRRPTPPRCHRTALPPSRRHAPGPMAAYRLTREHLQSPSRRCPWSPPPPPRAVAPGKSRAAPHPRKRRAVRTHRVRRDANLRKGCLDPPCRRPLPRRPTSRPPRRTSSPSCLLTGPSVPTAPSARHSDRIARAAPGRAAREATIPPGPATEDARRSSRSRRPWRRPTEAPPSRPRANRHGSVVAHGRSYFSYWP
jgi:hypothetical protein